MIQGLLKVEMRKIKDLKEELIHQNLTDQRETITEEIIGVEIGKDTEKTRVEDLIMMQVTIVIKRKRTKKIRRARKNIEDLEVGHKIVIEIKRKRKRKKIRSTKRNPKRDQSQINQTKVTTHKSPHLSQ